MINDSKYRWNQEDAFISELDEDMYWFLFLLKFRVYQKIDVELFMDIKKAKNQLRLQIQKERINELIKKINQLIHSKQNEMKEKFVLHRRMNAAQDDIASFFT